jgi:signal transduction histidine kinase
MELSDPPTNAGPEEAHLTAEAQIAFLKRSNVALRRSVNRFAESGRFESLLESALLESMSVTGAVGGAITLWSHGLYAGTQCVAEDSVILPRETWEADPFFQEIPAVIGKDPDGFTSRLLSAPYTRESLEWAERFWPACAAYHGRLGHVEVWNVPCVVKGALVASLGLAFREPREGSTAPIGTLTALAQQMGLMIEMARLAAQEREAIADRERAASLARANAALQATIDALGEARNLDRIVPRVLQIVAETFRATSCSVFENDPSGTVWLRYWNVEGRTLAPDELMRLDTAKYGLVRQLAEGFEAPDSYLGIPTTAPGTAVLDHVRGTSVPEFDRFAVSTGWELELNIGVGAGGVRATTLCVYRGKAHPFTAAEIALAESLATQLGLAVQFTKLADESKEAAVIREREAAAEQKAAELGRANRALKAAVDSLAAAKSGPMLLQGILGVVRDTIEAVSVRLAICDRQLLAAIARGNPSLDAEAAEHGFAEYLSQGKPEFTALSQCGVLSPEAEEFFRSQGVKGQLTVPLILGDELIGALKIRLRQDEMPPQGQVEMAQSLAHQATLAIRLTELAIEAQHEAAAKATSEERAALARELHDTLLQSFTGITLQLRALGRRSLRDDSALALLADIEQQATDSVQEARRAVGELRNPEKIELFPALRNLVESERAEAAVKLRDVVYGLTEGGDPWEVPAPAGKDLLRMAREALKNAARHSGASQIRTSIEFTPEFLRIQVEDNGCGFDLDEALSKPAHFGISGMGERGRRIRALLEIRTRPAQGTSILIEYPAGDWPPGWPPTKEVR